LPYVCHIAEWEYVPYENCTKFPMLPTRFPTQAAIGERGEQVYTAHRTFDHEEQ